MYCRKCGKFFDYEGDLCKECAATADPFGEEAVVNAQEAEPQQSYQAFYSDYVAKNRGFSTARKGFIFAIIALVVANIAVYSAYFNYFMVSEGLDNNLTLDYAALLRTGITCGVVFGIASVGLSIPAIVCGIKSIVTFARAAKEGGAKPVKTLVFGIISAAHGVSGVMGFFSILMIVAEMAYAL